MFRSKRTVVVLLAAGLFLGGLLAVGGYLKKTYTIRTVYVEGNVHYTEEEIKAIVMDGFLGDNSLYLSLKYKNKGIEGIPFVDVVDVDILSPDTIKIIVYEKAMTGCVRYLDTYVYFDRDGYVVESSGVRTVGIPQIIGLDFDYIMTGEMLPVEDKEIFRSILDLTKLLQKYNLTPDRIYFNSLEDITIYFGDTKVALGNEAAHLEDKLMILPDFLVRLEGRSGILQMQTYDEDSGKYTFKPEG